ncbi:FG-GAP repeat domain-containing protein [Streptomyces lavenduligriseus]|uniref:VCBS repeat-containing protein n=1 Tax=Streptomyces lavenduligriseus TaxID=67315 RepID=A0ABT0P298_9ACTN|nr:VCBS repeat-containing protein [Streptomyces lavenduligriseus]MCL3997850.1 VCBS repeat-containing protein [Streptomyces lavenduligriseus]
MATRGHTGTPRPGRRTRAALVLVGLLLCSGCEDSLGQPPPRPAGPSAVAACLTGSGDLIADVDNDGRPDRITDPSHHGARLTITFGTGSRRERTVPARGLADRPGNRQQYVRAAVADFDQDGWSDLVVVAGQAQGGDDPVPPRVAELRLGPFSGTGRSRRTVRLDLGVTQDIAVADYDHDRYPDLASYTYAGDGVYVFEARLGDPRTGLRAGTRAYTTDAGATGHHPPARLPHAGLTPFYPGCGAR